MPFIFATLSAEAEIRNWAYEFINDQDASMIGCWAITEPAHGTDWIIGTSSEGSTPRLAPGVTAVKKGDEYILNGWKSAWVSNGTIATHAVLHVGLDPSMAFIVQVSPFVPLIFRGFPVAPPWTNWVSELSIRGRLSLMR